MLNLILFKFFKPLPLTLRKFKSEITELFPTIYDTKMMCLNLKKEIQLEEFG